MLNLFQHLTSTAHWIDPEINSGGHLILGNKIWINLIKKLQLQPAMLME